MCSFVLDIFMFINILFFPFFWEGRAPPRWGGGVLFPILGSGFSIKFTNG